MDKKKKRLFKIFGVGTICALMFACVVLPFSACNLKYDTSEQSQASPINLDPENDEVIAYTNGGIPIRSHNVVGSNTTSYQYMTLGTYQGTPVNWLIVAASDKGLTENSTPAGQAINAETAKDTFYGKVESGLERGQLLLISEYAFNIVSYNHNLVAHASVNTDITITCGGYSETYVPTTYRNSLISNATGKSDEGSDFVGSNLMLSSTIPTLTNDLGLNSLGLLTYKNRSAIVFNSNLSTDSCYVFSLSNEQITNYLPASLRIAYDFSNRNTKLDYWLRDFNATVSGSFGTSFLDTYTGTYSRRWYHYYITGSRTYTDNVMYVNTLGETVSTSQSIVASSVTLTMSNYNQYSWTQVYVDSSGHTWYYFANLPINYVQSGPSITAYLRPAMVVDFSKL